ncbi:MAG: tRNA 2-selenouridine(34) synthase MnmH [Bacteriovoracia bacterium]
MGKHLFISAPEALKRILAGASVGGVDVRSEGEYARGAIPLFSNIPILNNSERHEVGLCYKAKGQAEAVQLGHSLVDGHRDRLVRAWKEKLSLAAMPVVTCWRGGLRSETACRWLEEAGVASYRLSGGYKSLRNELLRVYERLPDLLVLAGPTGSGKTKLLESLQGPAINLEKIARHRGSAFGPLIGTSQPSQASFENILALQLWRFPKLLVEDESLMIGKIHLPKSLREKMLGAPVVKIRRPVLERVENIFSEYVAEPLAAGVPPAELSAQYAHSLSGIRNKLGGGLTEEVRGKMGLAFVRNHGDLHREWIRDLLLHYYDKAYHYGFARNPRAIAFEGDWNECRNWIQSQFA